MLSPSRLADRRAFALYSAFRSSASSATVILAARGIIARPSSAAPSRSRSSRLAELSFSVSLDSRLSWPLTRYFSHQTDDSFSRPALLAFLKDIPAGGYFGLNRLPMFSSPFAVAG